MEECYNRSKSYSATAAGGLHMEPYNYGKDLRSYSVSHSSSSTFHHFAEDPPLPPLPSLPNLNKGKKKPSNLSSSWSFNDPEFQRKTRVASYKVYSVEGKVKGSFRRSFRWLKNSYTRVVYGWW